MKQAQTVFLGKPRRANYIAAFILAIAVSLATGCATQGDIKKQTYEPGASDFHVHVVTRGDTLNSIAKRYDSSLPEILAINKISDPGRLEVGIRVYVPVSGGKSAVSVAQSKKYSDGLDANDNRDNSNFRKTSLYRSNPDIVLKGVRFVWPVEGGDISSGFGVRRNGKHDGIDIRAPKGTPIRAAEDGEVLFSGRGPKGYGNIVILKHKNDIVTVYAHNQKNSVRVRQQVKQGETVAYVGNSGRATGYHCHFELRVDRKAIDPVKYLAVN